MRKMRLWKAVSAFAAAAVLVTGCGGASGAASSQESAPAAEAAQENAPEAEAAQEETAQKSAEAPAETAPEEKPEEKEAETLAADPGAEEGSLNSAPGTPAAAAVDCSFELEGKKYTLPLPVSELLSDGYYLNADMNTEIDGYTYTWVYLTKEEGSYDDLTIDLFNGSGNKKVLGDCTVSSVEVASQDLQNFSFALSNGIKPGDLPETVEQTMGTPTDKSDGDSSLTYYYGESRETGQIEFNWWKENGELTGESQITVKYFATEETTSSTEVPEYLSEYKAPSAIGEDFDSGTVSLDGVVYQLPCPVSELVKNGWAVDKDDDVMAGRLGSVRLAKGDTKISLYVMNYANYQTTGSNCAATRISYDYYSDTDPIPDFILPKGLSFSTDKAALESILESTSVEFNTNESDSYIIYTYDDYDLDTGVTINYDKEKAKITGLSVEREIWP